MPTNSGSSRVTADIICDEAGTPDGKFWRGSLSEIGEDYDAIRSHEENRTIRVVERAGKIEIRARDRVGVLGLPSGRRILLRTKIPGIVLYRHVAQRPAPRKATAQRLCLPPRRGSNKSAESNRRTC